MGGVTPVHRQRRRAALAAKLLYTLFVLVLVPVYWDRYGPSNFLWFSDIALLAALLALWLESRLLASMMAVAVLLPEIAWNIGFFGLLLFGVDVIGLARYMVDPALPLYLRALSLFHVFLPPTLLWMVYRWGYDRRALASQTVLAWVVLPLSWRFAEVPGHNINWTLGLGDQRQTWMADWQWVLLLMAAYPLLVYLPTHLLLRRLFPPKGRGGREG